MNGLPTLAPAANTHNIFHPPALPLYVLDNLESIVVVSPLAHNPSVAAAVAFTSGTFATVGSILRGTQCVVLAYLFEVPAVPISHKWLLCPPLPWQYLLGARQTKLIEDVNGPHDYIHLKCQQCLQCYPLMAPHHWQEKLNQELLSRYYTMPYHTSIRFHLRH
ncbi:MAG: hypothetical protein EZS28_008279 [Streblomastix strix]|uniref:Uncharacterized protein n=1 Tax=Streblomastix strix TaxID=222440 RepID=A0A5J4WMS7_9EUKA|nr:MAG: hypothetical protein EZS28_008279 [Streblomastix strix]